MILCSRYIFSEEIVHWRSGFSQEALKGRKVSFNNWVKAVWLSSDEFYMRVFMLIEQILWCQSFAFSSRTERYWHVCASNSKDLLSGRLETRPPTERNTLWNITAIIKCCCFETARSKSGSTGLYFDRPLSRVLSIPNSTLKRADILDFVGLFVESWIFIARWKEMWWILSKFPCYRVSKLHWSRWSLLKKVQTVVSRTSVISCSKSWTSQISLWTKRKRGEWNRTHRWFRVVSSKSSRHYARLCSDANLFSSLLCILITVDLLTACLLAYHMIMHCFPITYPFRKHALNCHRMKPALFNVLCEIKEKTGK